MKKGKGAKNGHTASSQIGMGDSYGQAVKAPLATITRSYMDAKPKPVSALGKPPKALA